MQIRILVQTKDFDINQELKLAEKYAANCGAIINFIGKVRGNDNPQQPLSHLYLTHMPEVTEHEISKIITQAVHRWPISYACVIHRIGKLSVGDQIVLVLTASEHRDHAYQANRYIMDYLKTEAPFWKKECFANGQEYWVEMKHSDQQHAQSWQ